MFGKTGLQTFLNVAIHSEAADGDSANPRNSVEASHEFGAAAIGQRDIADEQIELISRACLHGRAHVVHRRDEVTASGQQSFQS